MTLMQVTFSRLAPACVAALALAPVQATAQDRAFSFSVTGGATVQPDYFGSDSHRLGPSGALGFSGLVLGGISFGSLESPDVFSEGVGLRGAFRYIPQRKGEDELAGLRDVDDAVELGVGLHYTTEHWQVYTDIRYGVIGHSAFTGEAGANLILRPTESLTLHAGPRAKFGSGRFMRTYFGVTEAEAAASGLGEYRPSGGVQSLGVEFGAYQALTEDWGVSGAVRFDRLRGDAGASPIVEQGNRDQLSATVGVTRHFNLRF